MPIAFLAQAAPLDWKGLGAVLGVVLAALAVARIFGTPVAEKTILWVLRDQVKRWDSGALMHDLHRAKADAYEARARGWDVVATLAESNKERLDNVDFAVREHTREIKEIVRALERCEANAETLERIERKVDHNGARGDETAREVASIKGIMAGIEQAERRSIIRRETDK